MPNDLPPGEVPRGRAIALDGGTTNTRARLVVDGRVVATARRAVGVRDAAMAGGDARPLAVAIREAIAEAVALGGGEPPGRIVAAGMLSSEVGLAAVPHVAPPAGLDELAAGAVALDFPAVADRPILVVPGVRTPPADGPDGWAAADVMRGEECETLGAWLALRPDGPTVFVWPGSHSKVVFVDATGRIVRSFTTLAGELTAAVAGHTLLRASLPAELPTRPDPAAVAAGGRIAAADGLGRAAFLVRVAAIAGTYDAEQRAAFWLGAVVGDDAASLARTIGTADGPVIVGGRQPLRSLYVEAFGRHPAVGSVRELDEATEANASAWGALAVAARRDRP